MKILINSVDDDFIDNLLKYTRDKNIEVIITKNEKFLMETISTGELNAFILQNLSYTQKIIDFIKLKQAYSPICIFGSNFLKVLKGDLYFIYDKSFSYEVLIKNIIQYEKNFSKLQKLLIKTTDIINFSNCSYDPNNRIFYNNQKEIAKLSDKAGGILEILAINFGTLLKKELILEKVWAKNDYCSSRSMDVYVTSLRNIFKNNNITLEIKNISKSGLILQ